MGRTTTSERIGPFRLRETPDACVVSTSDPLRVLFAGIVVTLGAFAAASQGVWSYGFAAVVSAVLTGLAFVALRVRVRVTRATTSGSYTVAGLAVRSCDLGRHPQVGDGGWDWAELAVTPRDPALRRGLHDDERFVLAEWRMDDDARNAAGRAVAERLRAAMVRLQGVALEGPGEGRDG